MAVDIGMISKNDLSGYLRGLWLQPNNGRLGTNKY